MVDKQNPFTQAMSNTLGFRSFLDMTIDIAGDWKYPDTELYPIAWHYFKRSLCNGRNDHGQTMINAFHDFTLQGDNRRLL